MSTGQSWRAGGSAGGATCWLRSSINTVCINQENTVERNQQVHLMKTIYSQARGVLIWLSKGDEHSDMLFEVISKDGILSLPDRNKDSDNNRLQEQFNIKIYRLYTMFSTIAKRP